MVFVAVRPRVVILKPDGDASFGLNYVDAAHQQDPNGAVRTAQDVEMSLPVRLPSIRQQLRVAFDLQFLLFGFRGSGDVDSSGAVADGRLSSRPSTVSLLRSAVSDSLHVDQRTSKVSQPLGFVASH
jgi:hypothetical protein